VHGVSQRTGSHGLRSSMITVVVCPSPCQCQWQASASADDDVELVVELQQPESHAALGSGTASAVVGGTGRISLAGSKIRSRGRPGTWC
jgi:hypothetical protein